MNLELEKKKLELQKVETAKMEMEFKVMERMADVNRIKENIENQEKRINELKELIQKQKD